MRRPNWKSTAAYSTLLAGVYLIALLFSWFFGTRLDDYAYDTMFNAYRAAPWQPEVVLLATRWARALLDRVDALVARAVAYVKPP